MEQDTHGARVGLLATQALLLAGDDVRVEVDVAPGAWLDIVETTGTVAYEGEVPSSWVIEATVGDEALLTWAGKPFVVSDGIATRAGQTGGDLNIPERDGRHRAGAGGAPRSVQADP